MAVLMGARASALLAAGRYLDRSASRTRALLPAMGLVAVGFVGLGFAHGITGAVAALSCLVSAPTQRRRARKPARD